MIYIVQSYLQIYLLFMRIGTQGKPKLQILKAPQQYNHRTQENSPVHFDQMPAIHSQQFTIPAVGKKTVRNGFGSTSRPVRSLKNSKQKQPSNHKNFPVFDLNLLKNSLGPNFDKQEAYDITTIKKKKDVSASHRLNTEKKYRLTEISDKHEQFPGDRKWADQTNKINFRLNNKPKSLQKTEEVQQAYVKSSRKIISFPKNEKIKLEGQGGAEYHSHRSVGKYEKKLTPMEKEESANYEIFYIGPRRIYSKSDFTDSQGDPKVMIHDSIAYRYEIICQLGRGSFGKVFKVFDHKKKEFAALKLIKSQKKFLQQAKIQVQILQTALLRDPKSRSNIVKMRSSFVFRGHSCITFQILHKNLYEFLKEHQFSGFSHDLIRRFAIQILQALTFFKKNSIIHCDLKPENILLKEENKSGIRVIDVGSGCFEEKQLYTYIQSRFYRAPEIILGIRYTPAIDMWSFGCILVELFTGFPIFPGESENQQMLLFFQVLGYPSSELLKYAERRKKFFNDDFECKIPQEPGKERKPSSVRLQDIIGSNDSQFVNLISRCLEWDPRKRINPFQGLVHPWILKGLPEQIRQQHLQQMKQQLTF